MPYDETVSPLPPASRPDEQAFRFSAARPAMPSPAAGAPGRWIAARRAMERAGPALRGSTEREEGGVRTDLALEAYQALADRAPTGGVSGVETERHDGKHASVHRVRITSAQGAAALRKAPGTYTTVESPGLRERSTEAREEVARLVSEELTRLLEQEGVGREAPVLVAGLGNWNATPDSLGPRVVGQMLVTRHIHALLPPEKRGSLRPVSAISPGVLGLTGIETTELVAGVVDRVKPAAVICVDALAAGSAERLCATVQLSDAGLQPGAGVGNVRKGLNREALGMPVIAIGVPTVIHASRLGAAPQLRDWPAPAAAFPPLLRGSTVQASPMGPTGPGASMADAGFLSSLIVTPKEIDVLIEDAAELVAEALNAALHPGVDLDEVVRSIP